jgi:hypothetical protein
LLNSGNKNNNTTKQPQLFPPTTQTKSMTKAIIDYGYGEPKAEAPSQEQGERKPRIRKSASERRGTGIYPPSDEEEGAVPLPLIPRSSGRTKKKRNATKDGTTSMPLSSSD